jgi:RNA polymerase sigma factor (sigma-70 family)
MTEHDWLADRFEANRTHLRAVAYRMLGSVSEADDAVQEAWLRLSRADTSGVENLGAWLTTVVARVSLDMLRSRNARREQPLETRVPEPIVSTDTGADPEHAALLADSVGLALLVVLERLSPAERLAFVLHDMFGVPFDNSRAGHAAGCAAPPRSRTSTSPASERWSTRSWPRHATVTSTPSSRSLPRTSRSASTAVRAPRGRSAAPRSWPGRRSPSRSSPRQRGRRS